MLKNISAPRRTRTRANLFDETALRDVTEAYQTPAAALALAIMRLTLCDLSHNNPRVRHDAHRFVRSENFAILAGALELDVPTVRARFERIAAANPL